jgi:ferrochelatase
MNDYDALLVVSFGGPEGPDDVMPFLRNVVEGRNVPEERLRIVEERYLQFGGVSPINAETRALVDAIQAEIPELPVYWGNRNWRPFLADTLSEMKDAGVARAVAFATSAYSSYSSCRQYLEDIDRARDRVGEGAPRVDKIPPFSDHPGFVEANRERLAAALAELGAETPTILFTAHSLPESMASECDYADELERVKTRLQGDLGARLVYQSRSGPPSVPWLGPDVLDALGELAREGVRDVVLAPIGFVCDHMEVIYDLDVEAKELADELGLRLVRARTVGTHPRFVRMVRELVEAPVTACAPDCCPAPHERPRR